MYHTMVLPKSQDQRLKETTPGVSLSLSSAVHPLTAPPHQPVRRLHGSRRILPLMFLRMNAAKARTSLMILIRNSRLLMHADFAANLWKPVAFLPVGWLSRRLADKSMDSGMANSAGCFPFPTGIAQNPSGRVSHLSIHPVRWVRHKPCSG